MKILFYCLWGFWSIIILLAICFNHYAEFYMAPYRVELLFNEHSQQWAFTNAIITIIWAILTWIGLHILYKKDVPSDS